MTNQSIDITHSQLQVAAETRTRILQEAKRQIWVSFQREGIHKYPAALEDPQLAEL
jgi:frataxin-like iron-binding protein CyaY